MIKVEHPASVMRSLLFLWLFWFIGGEIVVLTYKVFLPDRLSGESPLVTWFWLPCICAVFAAIGVFVNAAIKTRYRQCDPYRFSSRQYRFAVVPKDIFEKLKNGILANGLSKTSSDSSGDWTTTYYKRPVKSVHSERSNEPTMWQVLNCAYSSSSGHLIIEAYLSWRVVKRLFRFASDNDTYNLLEDLISKSGLQQFLTDENWQPKK